MRSRFSLSLYFRCQCGFVEKTGGMCWEAALSVTEFSLPNTYLRLVLCPDKSLLKRDKEGIGWFHVRGEVDII